MNHLHHIHQVPISTACDALDLSRASYYREVAPKAPAAPPLEGKHPRALSDEEKQKVLEVLDSPRFVDVSPYQVYATLLDEGVYLCSVSTMYRILRENGQVRELGAGQMERSLEQVVGLRQQDRGMSWSAHGSLVGLGGLLLS